jgi:BirA family biotin operon repressor/biotin-[acetyl-CoA-carboxylase] ligase
MALEEKEEKLLGILGSGSYVSPEALAAEIGCTSRELEQVVSAIKEKGYEIELNPALGMRLLRDSDALSAELIRDGLETTFIGKSIYCRATVGSTNEEARSLGREGAPEGTTVVADEQTEGRGRFGKNWHSPAGQGIWMSIILRPSSGVEPLSAISLVAAYAVSIALRESAGVRALIKWPNDVRIGEKKVCGILAELEKDRKGNEFLVLGMGVNVSQTEFGGDLTDVATSVRIASGRDIPRVHLIRKILENLEKYYLRVVKEGFSEVLSEVRQLCTLVGKQVVANVGGERISAYVQDIDDAGRLIVRTEDGRIRELHAGEVNAVR